MPEPVVSSPTLPAPVKPAKPIDKTKPVTTAPAVPPRPVEKLHKELIPKNIEIIRCSYAGQDIAPVPATLGFDLNGTGFTSEFEKMIKIEAVPGQIAVKNLKLITANQIHGEMEISPDAKTQFVYPKVLIKNLPVFSAPEPFAVVRKGEVLTILFIRMEENGRGGRFRIITNLDETLARQFEVLPSTPGIEVGNLETHLPFAVDGDLRIRPGVPPGDYGLIVKIGGKEVFRRDTLIHIVRPNIGQSGFIQGVIAQDAHHRPGDKVQLYVQGTGLSPDDLNVLTAKVNEFEVGPGSFTYLSPIQLRLAFNTPATMPLGPYSVTISGAGQQKLFEKPKAFQMISANWVKGVQISPPIHPGQTGVLKIHGRDFSSDFVSGMKIDTDEPGITVQNIKQADSSILTADIAVSSSVAPGDYLMHLTNKGKKIDPPFGSLIKVEP
jgi:hypothetical protein